MVISLEIFGLNSKNLTWFDLEWGLGWRKQMQVKEVRFGYGITRAGPECRASRASLGLGPSVGLAVRENQ